VSTALRAGPAEKPVFFSRTYFCPPKKMQQTQRFGKYLGKNVFFLYPFGKVRALRAPSDLYLSILSARVPLLCIRIHLNDVLMHWRAWRCTERQSGRLERLSGIMAHTVTHKFCISRSMLLSRRYSSVS
jgi:hypothetical protein